MLKSTVILLLLVCVVNANFWHGIKMPWGGHGEGADVSQCVKPIAYWRTYNNKASGNMYVPWPVQPNTGQATEDKRICANGATWYEIVIGNENDAWHNVTRQAIVLYLNVLSGVNVPQDLYANWQTAMTDIQACCVLNSPNCDMSMFALWAEHFTEFNEGRSSIPPCAPTPTPPIEPEKPTPPDFIHPPADVAATCIQPRSYWITNNKHDNNVPWPPNPYGGNTILEDKQLCPLGATWLEILKSDAGSDQKAMLTHEVIVTYLNIRNGAPIPSTTYDAWRNAYGRLTECCFSAETCDTSMFASYYAILSAYTSGQQGVPVCGQLPTQLPDVGQCTCTVFIPLGCSCHVYKDAAGACQSAVISAGCVNDWMYYATNNKYDNNMPWPTYVGAVPPALEDKQFCAGGPTWLSILKTPSDNNAIIMLEKEFIAATLNGLAGASVSAELTEIKTQVFEFLMTTCSSQPPNMAMVYQWIQMLHDYNCGQSGVPSCVAPPPDVMCQCNLRCPKGCDCVCAIDAMGCCTCECKCPPVPPSDCQATINCPVGCETQCIRDSVGKCTCQCVCRGCVHDVDYWKLNNRYDNYSPWPANPEGLPYLENKQFCDAGLTWLELVRLNPGADVILRLSQQVITAYLNVLSGATIEPAAFQLWKLAYSRLVTCCNAQNTSCDLTDVIIWTRTLRDFNEGRAGVPECTAQVYCNIDCPQGCNCICTRNDAGNSVCQCVCPPLDCKCELECPAGCKCVVYLDTDKVCHSKCECPIPGDNVCPTVPFDCQPGCTAHCYIDQLGRHICECICPPAECVCNRPCPFGTQCVCDRDADNCCKCTCVQPSQNITLPFDCPTGCKVVWDSIKFACACKIPADCNIDVTCPPGCSIQCTRNATTGICACKPMCPANDIFTCPIGCTIACVDTKCTCICPDIPDVCTCTTTCPPNQLCDCKKVSGSCVCKCIDITTPCKPIMSCDVGCVSRCKLVDNKCVCECVCPPPPKCKCDMKCPTGCECVSELVDNKCVSRCVCPPADVNCTCTMKCPLGCNCETYVDQLGKCQSECWCYGCVRDASFWSIHNRYDTAYSWPANPQGYPDLESNRFCPLGPTWLSILKTPSTNATDLLAKQVIVAQLNILAFNASISPELLTLWKNAYNQLVGCCQGTLCDTTKFAIWNNTLFKYNNGSMGVVTCPDVCPCTVTCAAGCFVVCVPDTITGICLCHCECPTIIPECKCLPTDCPAGCKCCAYTDYYGVCQKECRCPCPPKECVCNIQCAKGCTCESFKSPNGTCINYCKCPPPPSCICDKPCPAGCNATCTFDEKGKPVCDCQCPPPADCVCNLECKPGCTCFAYRDRKGMCKSECRCPPPLDCVCNIHCPTDSECNCYKNHHGKCTCKCVSKPPPDCVCPIDCPEGATCVCTRGKHHKCKCECITPPPPDCVCNIKCDDGCTCKAYLNSTNHCNQKCVCPPPKDCVCNMNCPPGARCDCKKDMNGACVCECVKPPCKCDVQCPDKCKCVIKRDASGKCSSQCECPPPKDCIPKKPCPKNCTSKCYVDSNDKCICKCDCPKPPPQCPHPPCECEKCPKDCECKDRYYDKKHKTECCTECLCAPPKDCLCNIDCETPCNCTCIKDHHDHCDCKCNCVKDIKMNNMDVCVNPSSYYAERNKLTGMPWPSNPDGTPVLEDKKFCPTGKTWLIIMRGTGSDVINSLSREIITTYLNVLRGTPITSADWEKWQSAYAELTDCCFDPKFCRTANFDNWILFFKNYNEGNRGVVRCGAESSNK